MNKKPLNPLLLIGLIGVFSIGSQFFVDIFRVFSGNKEIYWTHPDMKLPLEKTENDFQIYIAGKPLKKHLSEKTLLSSDKEGIQYPIAAKDVSVRINNWNIVKSRILSKTAITGFSFGISLTLLIMGLIQTYTKKKKGGC